MGSCFRSVKVERAAGRVTSRNEQRITMPKELLSLELERDNLGQKWGFTIQGGADLALTAKVASVKRFSPADRAGLDKMDYVWTVNGKEVFKMTQKQITNEIVNSQLRLSLQVERGTFIVPSFDEIWPQAGKGRPGEKGWVWNIFWRQCSIMVWVTCHNQTTLPPVADLVLRLISTTILSSAIMMTQLKK